MQNIYELTLEGKIHLKLTHAPYSDDKAEEARDKGRELLLAAYHNKSYHMIAYLLRLGLSATRVWGSCEKVFIELRNFYIDEKNDYSEEFVDTYFYKTNIMSLDLMRLQKEGFFTWADSKMWG